MATPSPLPVLCINLRTATQRWASVQAEVRTHLPGAVLHRVEAVDWRDLPADLPSVALTPFSRHLLRHPDEQPFLRGSHRQVDTPSSVAIMLSHVLCWEWIAAHPTEPVALVLEDDACFDRDAFPAAWRTYAAPLLARPDAWDCVALGYFDARGAAVPTAVGDTGVTLRVLPEFFGSHAYLVTQRGAATLRKHAVPIELQVDGLLVTLQRLGWLRLFVLPTSAVSQCTNHLDRAGSWHTHQVAYGAWPCLAAIRDGGWTVALVLAVLVGLFMLLGATFARYWGRGAGGQRDPMGAS